MQSAASPSPAPSRLRRNGPLYLLIAVCIAPILASYYFYYVDPPSGRTNYGVLVQPQRPVPALTTTRGDGSAFDLRSLRGSWVMVMADQAACTAACQKKLWLMRQIRAASGKDAERIARVFLLLDRTALDPMLVREYDGTHFVQAHSAELERFLALPHEGALSDHIWLIDPVGNQMLRWPKDADPKGIKKDLERLLKASSIG